MISEQGRVTRIEGHYAWVSCQSQAACPRCAEGRGCGGGLIGLMLGARLHEVRVLMTRREITVGQCVLLGLRESALLKLAFATYVFPLLTMLAAAMLVASFVSRSNSAVLAGAVLGLAAGFAAIRWIGKRWRASPAMQPVLLD